MEIDNATPYPIDPAKAITEDKWRSPGICDVVISPFPRHDEVLRGFGLEQGPGLMN